MSSSHQSEIATKNLANENEMNKTISNIESEKFITTEPKPIITQPNSETTKCCRTILWYLVFTGFALQFMIRIILNIAIVDMVLIKKTNNVSINVTETSYCYDGKELQHTTIIQLAAAAEVDEDNINKRFSIERWLLDKFNVIN